MQEAHEPHKAEIRELWRALYANQLDAVGRGMRELSGSGSAFVRCEMRLLRGHRYAIDGEMDRAERELQIALGLALSRGCAQQTARTRHHLANVYEFSGRRALAAVHVDKAVDETPQPRYRNRLLLRQARIASELGRFEQAQRSLDEARKGGAAPEELSGTLLTNALRARDCDRLDELLDMLASHPPPEDQGGVIWALMCRGNAAKAGGRFEEAIGHFAAAREEAGDDSDQAHLILEARAGIVECRMYLRHSRAPLIDDLGAVLVELEVIRRPDLLTQALCLMARLKRHKGEIAESEALFTRAYQATADGEHPLSRLALALEHAWLLLDSPREEPGDRSRLPEILDEAGAVARKMAHPPFDWALRVLRAVLQAHQGVEEALVHLEECREVLLEARARGEICELDRDAWLQRLDARIDTARGTLSAKLARDSAMMDEVVRGLRSEDSRGHLAHFAASIRAQLAADRVAMVLEGAAEGSYDVVAAGGMTDAEAEQLAQRLLGSGILRHDIPIFVRDTTDPSNPVAVVLAGGRLLRKSAESVTLSLDSALLSAPQSTTRRSVMAASIPGADAPAGMVYLDRCLDSGQPPFRAADLRSFAFLANGVTAVTRIAIRPLTEENRRLRDRLTDVQRHGAMVTRSARMRQILQRIDLLRHSDLPVLVTGESGTGKELVARAVHERGTRSDGPFVPVNCAAIPRELLEAELFGYARGAFTGASRDKIGFFVEADGGTLFLDEIGEMATDIQAKLLRVLEDRVVTPLGRTKGVRVDFRIVAATHTDLRAAVEAREFRSDLYYRLHGVELDLPALRERMEDLPPLVDRFLDDFRSARDIEGELRLTTEAWEALERHHWPGNVRELRNAVLVAAELRERDTGTIPLESLPTHVVDSARKAGLVALGIAKPDEAIDAMILTQLFSSVERLGYKAVMEAIDRYVFSRALNDTGGNQRAAARNISIRESTLRQKSRRIGISGPRSRR